MKGLWERDFDETKDKAKILSKFDKLKERYINMRDELCHNLHHCMVNTRNIKTVIGKRHLVNETEYLTGKSTRDYLLSLLKITK